MTVPVRPNLEPDGEKAMHNEEESMPAPCYGYTFTGLSKGESIGRGSGVSLNHVSPLSEMVLCWKRLGGRGRKWGLDTCVGADCEGVGLDSKAGTSLPETLASTRSPSSHSLRLCLVKGQI